MRKLLLIFSVVLLGTAIAFAKPFNGKYISKTVNDSITTVYVNIPAKVKVIADSTLNLNMINIKSNDKYSGVYYKTKNNSITIDSYNSSYFNNNNDEDVYVQVITTAKNVIIKPGRDFSIIK